MSACGFVGFLDQRTVGIEAVGWRFVNELEVKVTCPACIAENEDETAAQPGPKTKTA